MIKRFKWLIFFAILGITGTFHLKDAKGFVVDSFVKFLQPYVEESDKKKGVDYDKKVDHSFESEFAMDLAKNLLKTLSDKK